MDVNLPAGSEVIGVVVSAILGGAFWFRKMKPVFAIDDKITAAANADNGIIERMTHEADRLFEQNQKLASTLNEFQLQVLKFQTENNKLSMENNTLREENMSLREEILELRKEVQELGKEIVQIRKNTPNCDMCPSKDPIIVPM